ncbi:MULTISPECIES: type IV pilus modification protein PilV [unclassified Janthinobacterium]|uniref:type IV pilus modification protein PilV n=1 Tax=unclassified Janthinobacterium TaxID=2610881 RepID=UPI000347B6D2|nr:MULTISPECIES: type IV pilus modification protein PilV [unclassified Janthinobacterium]MEC5163031.1 type IV pilus assembly protein PilV [Janthinobacterium sp. CG_S6]
MQAGKSAGFTMIEVLVAVLVLALGVVGGSAMQLSALRTRHQSALLSNALQLGAGMTERMRANAVLMRQPDAENPYLNLRYDVLAEGAPAAPAHWCFAAQPCSGAQLAAADIYELKRQIRLALPGGRLVICRDARRWNAAREGASWDCDGAAGAPVVIKLGWRGKHPDGRPLQRDAGREAPAVALVLAGTAP